MKPELMEKAVERAVAMLGAELATKTKDFVAADKRLEQTLEEDTKQYTFKINAGLKITVNRDNKEEVEVSASARWNTPEAIVTGTAQVSTHPELALDKSKDKKTA